jgi:hypothetical protein
MPVFKVGKSTGRTEGRVVDDNHPSFSITKDGTTHTFTGQIAIQNIDNTLPFSTHGDSGSVIINLDNKIVGLLFASGRNIPIGGTPQPFVTIANHISDVFAALKIRIPYSPDVKVISAETLRAVPTVLEAPIPEPYRVLRRRLQDDEVTAKLFAIGQRHSDEVTYLVNHCRPVTVAWRRAQGPAFLATVMGAVREGHSRIPPAIKGVTLAELLRRMQFVLSQNGSPALRETMNSARVNVEAILADCPSIDDLLARIASDRDLILTLKGIHP